MYCLSVDGYIYFRTIIDGRVCSTIFRKMYIRSDHIYFKLNICLLIILIGRIFFTLHLLALTCNT